MSKKVWFITGASKGMGLEVTKAVLANGDKVIGTSRNWENPHESLPGDSENFLFLKVDITVEAEVKAAIDKGIAAFGRIDVVLNNAGYYLVGSLEEVTDSEFRSTIDVNLFGTANVIRHSMPYLRRQQSGHIINISSNMGYIGYANTGTYNASKFAVIGLSEALAHEAKQFGVNVTVVAPGMFRTSFMSSGTLTVAQNTISEYGTSAHTQLLQSFDGKQPGDPQKLARVLLELSDLAEPPLHLPLGTDSFRSIIDQRKTEALELEQWRHLSTSTDFD